MDRERYRRGGAHGHGVEVPLCLAGQARFAPRRDRRFERRVRSERRRLSEGMLARIPLASRPVRRLACRRPRGSQDRKGPSSRRSRRELREPQRRYRGRPLWGRGRFCAAAGVGGRGTSQAPPMVAGFGLSRRSRLAQPAGFSRLEAVRK